MMWVVTEPSLEDVKIAVDCAHLTWFDWIKFGIDNNGVMHLTMKTGEDFESAPSGLMEWFAELDKSRVK